MLNVDGEGSVDESDDAENDDCVMEVSAEEIMQCDVDPCGDDPGVLSNENPELQALLQGGDYRTASKKPLQTKDNSVESLDALYGVERRKVFGGSKVGGRCGAGAWSCAGVPDVEKHWCECVGE